MIARSSLIVLVLLLTIAAPCFGQKSYSSSDSGYVKQLHNYMVRHIRYPAKAREDHVTGEVNISFSYSANKTIGNIRVLKELRSGCSEEVVRVLKAYAGTYPVKAGEYLFSVRFLMNDDTSTVKNDFDVEAEHKKRLRNYLFNVDIIGYHTIKRYILNRERTGYISPSFDAVKSVVKTSTIKGLIINTYHNDSLVYKTKNSYNRDGNIIENLCFDSKGKLKWKKTYLYNEQKRLTTTLTYHANGELLTKREYHYDQRGRQIVDGYDDKDNKLGNRTVSVYDTTGLKVREGFYSAAGATYSLSEYKYDDKGRMVEDIHYSSDGKVNYKTIRSYSENDSRVSDMLYAPDGSVLYHDVHLYNSRHQKLEDATYGPDEKLQNKDTYAYDEKGNQTEEVLDIMSDKPGIKSTFSYSDYDKKDNWRKANWTDGHQNKSYIIKRKISYYR